MRLLLPPVFDYQHKALFGSERYAVVEGSTKAGKTHPSIIWLLSELGRVGMPGRAFWWVAPTHEQAEIAYKRTKAMLASADAGQTIWTAQDVRKRIQVTGKGEICFKTGEDPDNLYGEDVFAAVMDEYTRQREESWYALRSTLTATGGRLRLIGNVNGRKNWGWRLARMAEQGKPGMSYTKLTWREPVGAGIMPLSEVEDARAMLPEAVFKELYEAEPSEDGSNPFGCQHIDGCVTGGLSTAAPIAFGVDLAKSTDYTVVIGLDKSGAVCRFDRWHGVEWGQTEERIAAMVKGVKTLIDSTGVGDPIVERLKRSSPMCDGFKFTQGSKQQLMEGLAVAIQQRRVRYPDGEIRKELDLFEYVPTRTGVTYSAPSGLHDDCVCALALAVACHTKQASANVYVGFLN